jgi:hydrogenase nickel incorporation protein HypA/HybF
MHEFALAEAVVATALDVARKEGLSVLTRVDVGIGELQQIRRETFDFALREVLPHSEPRIAGTEFRVEIEPARFRCRPCTREFGLRETGGPATKEDAEAIHFVPELAHAFLSCPRCKSPDFEVTAGRGVHIQSITGDER